MSWSFNAVGKPEKVIEDLRKKVSDYGEGQSRDEFEAAIPHLIGLIEQNVVVPGHRYPECLVHVEASGSGSLGSDGKVIYSSCQVSIKQIYGVLL